MDALDRVAIVVEPKEPFRAWVRGLEAESLIDSMGPDELATVYLLPAPVEDGADVLAPWYAEIFEEQLTGWWRDRRVWPRSRTRAVFDEWFAVRVIDLVFDAGN
jgi:hypothetical protein